MTLGLHVTLYRHRATLNLAQAQRKTLAYRPLADQKTQHQLAPVDSQPSFVFRGPGVRAQE
jgi:hypothetical protein